MNCTMDRNTERSDMYHEDFAPRTEIHRQLGINCATDRNRVFGVNCTTDRNTQS